ncbi:MAG: hypothetical protein AAF705_07095, partial [Bacteroidota bacterium]
MRKILWVCLGVFLLTNSCLNREEFSQEELQALVEIELERRLIDYRHIKLKRCEENLLAEADLIVDSLIFIAAQPEDTISIPKPARPEIRVVQDTRPIAPLFDTIIDGLNLDSLE